MADRNVYEVGRVTDIDGSPVTVGVDYDTVVVCGRRLDHAGHEEFARLFVAAVWRAALSLPLTAALSVPVEIRNGLPEPCYVYRGLGYDQMTGDRDA